MVEQPDNKPESKHAIHGELGGAFSLGVSFLANVLVGMAMGYGLDVWLETKPLFLLIFLFLGFAAGMRTIIKMAQAKK